jgi:hypothetical protein
MEKQSEVYIAGQPPQSDSLFEEGEAAAMSTSFVGLEGKGFWSRDYPLEIWLALLADEIDETGSVASWLRDASQHWRTQATAGMTGCVSPRLSQFAASQEQRSLLLPLVSSAADRLKAQTTISAQWLRDRGIGGPGSQPLGDVPVDVILDVANKFFQLLKGEIKTGPETRPTE